MCNQRLLVPLGIQLQHEINLSATLVEQVRSENNYQGSVAPSNCVKPLNMPALQLADIVCNCLKCDSAQNKEQHCFPLK